MNTFIVLIINIFFTLSSNTRKNLSLLLERGKLKSEILELNMFKSLIQIT